LVDTDLNLGAQVQKASRKLWQAFSDDRRHRSESLGEQIPIGSGARVLRFPLDWHVEKHGQPLAPSIEQRCTMRLRRKSTNDLEKVPRTSVWEDQRSRRPW